MSDVFRVERPGLVHLIGPLDDRSAVGEHRELVTLRGELQQEPIVTICGKKNFSPDNLAEFFEA